MTESDSQKAYPVINFTPKPQDFSRGVANLTSLSFSDLCKFAGHSVEEESATGFFLLSLKEAYILMVTRIAERNPNVANYKNPQGYPEFEIYDSVQGILEDEDLAMIRSEVDPDGNLSDVVNNVCLSVFGGLNELFCSRSGWDPQHLRPILGGKVSPLENSLSPFSNGNKARMTMPFTEEELEEFTQKILRGDFIK